MNVVYADMNLGTLCAIEYLGKKYAQRASNFTVVATDYGICGTEAKCRLAVGKIFPGCHFAFLYSWDVKAVDRVTRVYCMANCADIAAELKKVGRCSQIYLFAGTMPTAKGYQGDPRAENDVAAYEYAVNCVTGYGMHITSTETKLRFDLLRFNGISNLAYFDRFQKEQGIYCPELLFVLIVESRQGFMFHLFANNTYIRDTDVKKVLSQELNHRYNEFFRVYKQRCEVYRCICYAFERAGWNSLYSRKSGLGKLYMNVAIFMFFYTEGLSKDRRIAIAENLLNKWNLQCFTTHVTWLLEHVEDYMYMRSDSSDTDFQIVLWKSMHYMDAQAPQLVIDCMAEYSVTGGCKERPFSSADYLKWKDFIRQTPDFDREWLEEIFCLLELEIGCCRDVVQNGKVVFARDFAFRRLGELKRKVLLAYDSITKERAVEQLNVFSQS